ncbi:MULTISPECIES: hypothetical protein [unclassified Blastococcus]|uniref:hypothetical protein n=1 Tax=unclassified Blastococcus TaxID=2619396 RepID=UPI001EF10F89|nr:MULTISPECIES: hypothetical protein [unclassified Blastococcus]
MQALLEFEQPRHLLLGELADRAAGGPGHHLGDVLDAHPGDGRPFPATVLGLRCASATWSRNAEARSYCSAATAWAATEGWTG